MSPRTMIIKCFNYRENILRAVRTQKEVTYQNNKIRFLPNPPTEVKQQRSYDDVRKQLREHGLDKHRILYLHGFC